jgi:hypothetical protein
MGFETGHDSQTRGWRDYESGLGLAGYMIFFFFSLSRFDLL